jgi:hypothetical protein
MTATLSRVVAAGLTAGLAFAAATVSAQAVLPPPSGPPPGVLPPPPSMPPPMPEPIPPSVLPPPGVLPIGPGPSLNLPGPPTIVQQNGVRFLSGGVSLEERDQMRSTASGFDLRLMFSGARSGELIAGVETTIHDSRGREVLRLPAGGPIVYAELPSGTYTIIANHRGQIQRRTITVQNGRITDAHLTWPDSPQGSS